MIKKFSLFLFYNFLYVAILFFSSFTLVILGEKSNYEIMSIPLSLFFYFFILSSIFYIYNKKLTIFSIKIITSNVLIFMIYCFYCGKYSNNLSILFPYFLLITYILFLILYLKDRNFTDLNLYQSKNNYHKLILLLYYNVVHYILTVFSFVAMYFLGSMLQLDINIVDIIYIITISSLVLVFILNTYINILKIKEVKFLMYSMSILIIYSLFSGFHAIVNVNQINVFMILLNCFIYTYLYLKNNNNILKKTEK